MKKQIILLAISLMALSVFAIMRSSPTKAASVDHVSYSNDIRPILESRCRKCHMGEYVNKDLHMDTYESLMAGSQNGPVIIPGNAGDSLLVKKVVKGEMPKRGPKLTPVQIQLITEWINAGAPNN